MWQLIDIAYVIPVTIGLGLLVSKFLESRYEGNFLVPCVLVALTLGTILTIVKIKRVLDQINKKPKD